MGDGESANPRAGVSSSTGVYLAILQLVFTLGWTVYAIYLPRLAAQVGIAPTAVILILMLDQAIFTITDTAMGIFADKIAPIVGRLGVFVATLTALSCAAFVALPFIAETGPNSQAIFIALFLSALAMLGYGVAGAVSPYLGVTLRNQDPRLPFVISSVVLLITAMALSKVERGLAQAPRIEAKQPVPATPLGTVPMAFIAAMVIFALGYQLHLSINRAPFFLRFATPADLEWLLPVFWIGFNIAMFPASIVVKHRGGLFVMGAAGLLGAIAVIGTEMAGSLNMLISAQFLAGAAWGCMLMSAVSAALAIGETGAEGKVVGLVFSALALATFARMAAVAGGLQKLPDYAPLLHWAPVACWSVAGAGLLVLAAGRMRQRAQPT
jgi:hypothetical protein